MVMMIMLTYTKTMVYRIQQALYVWASVNNKICGALIISIRQS